MKILKFEKKIKKNKKIIPEILQPLIFNNKKISIKILNIITKRTIFSN